MGASTSRKVSADESGNSPHHKSPSKPKAWNLAEQNVSELELSLWLDKSFQVIPDAAFQQELEVRKLAPADESRSSGSNESTSVPSLRSRKSKSHTDVKATVVDALQKRGPDQARFSFKRRCFDEDEALASAVRRWEAGETDTIYIDAEGLKSAHGCLPAMLPPLLRGKPIFQCFLEQLDSGEKSLTQAFPSVIFCDDQCVAFLPAGFRGTSGSAERNAAAFAGFVSSAHESGGKVTPAMQQELMNSTTLTPLTINPSSMNQGHARFVTPPSM